MEYKYTERQKKELRLLLIDVNITLYELLNAIHDNKARYHALYKFVFGNSPEQNLANENELGSLLQNRNFVYWL